MVPSTTEVPSRLWYQPLPNMLRCMRALCTLVKDILFIIYICSELNIPLLLPAVIMEDNFAVVAVSNEESAYLKKCKQSHGVIRPQTELGRCSKTSSLSGTTRRQKPPRLACARHQYNLPTCESVRHIRTGYPIWAVAIKITSPGCGATRRQKAGLTCA